ncbi:MAG: hypothetical protein F6K19_43630 [Cyanothece sp. SIO1E1]|nr:hypothetical protein [Cyanothece sp. SIO1E1]
MKNICSEQSLSQLVQDYQAAKQLDETTMVQSQIAIVQSLKALGTPAAIAQLGELMINGVNHEYMDFALPGALADLLPQPEQQSAAISALVQGILHGQSETLQTVCIRKLLQAGYFALYPILIDYRNFLLLDQAHRPPYWASLLSTVSDAITNLHPYIDPAHQADVQHLWLNQPITLP